MTSQLAVTILISARNRPLELAHTLQLLRAQSYHISELIVIDDASDVSLQSVVVEKWPGAIFIRNSQRKGVVANRTVGLKQATEDVIVSLDDDSCFTRSTDLEKAVERLGREPELGILSFHLVDDLSTFNKCAERIPERYVHHFFEGANMMRRSVAEQLGGYYDRLFYGAEATEFSLRALDAGWRILYFPEVVVFHRLSAVGRSSRAMYKYAFRNLLWIIVLRIPFPRCVLDLGWRLAVGVLDSVKERFIKESCWAVTEFFRGLSGVLRDRAPVTVRTLRLYDGLRLGRVYTATQLIEPPEVSVPQMLLYVASGWLRTRRRPSLWAWLRRRAAE
jgi:GT2 family glycosyltransferase